MEFLNCIIYLLIITVAIFLVGRFYPRKWIFENKFPFRAYKIEKDGKIYERIKIRKWKTIWPDASMILHAIMPKHYPKKRMETADTAKIPVLIKESCVAEMTHVVASVLGWGCAIIWRNIGGIILSTLYFLCNLPPIIIQRYNRPRLIKALRATKKLEKSRRKETNDELNQKNIIKINNEPTGETISA